MGKVVDIHDRERKAAKCLGMTLRAFLDRKALLLRQAEGMRKKDATVRRIHKSL